MYESQEGKCSSDIRQAQPATLVFVYSLVLGTVYNIILITVSITKCTVWRTVHHGGGREGIVPERIVQPL